MAVFSIRNSTGNSVTLYDGSTRIASIAKNQLAQQLPLTVTKVALGTAAARDRTSGSFVDGGVYVATVVGATITFTAEGHPTVKF